MWNQPRCGALAETSHRPSAYSKAICSNHCQRNYSVAVDVVVANAPYVPTDSIRLMPPEARLHEPLVSLDGGTDGLDLQRRIIADAAPWLRPGGCLLVETSTEQVEMTVETFSRGGFSHSSGNLQ